MKQKPTKAAASVPSKAVKRGSQTRVPGQTARQAEAQRKQNTREQVAPKRKSTPMPKANAETTWTKKYGNDYVGRKTPKGKI